MRSVLFINYEYPPVGAGAATATYYFATLLAAEGIHVTVLTSAFGAKKGTTVEDGVTLYRLPALRKKPGQSSIMQMLAFLCSALLHLPRVVRNTRPERVVIFFSFPCGPAGLLLRRLFKIPYALMLRGSDVPGNEPSLDRIHRLLSPVRKAVYRNSSAVIANSNSLRDLALRSDPESTISVIPNGIDTEYYQPAESSSENTRHHFTFIFAGRICVQKNLGMLIEAFSSCYKTNPGIKIVTPFPSIAQRKPSITPTMGFK